MMNLGAAKTSKVVVLPAVIPMIQKFQGTVRWQPGELGRLSRTAFGVSLYKTSASSKTAAPGASGPVIPTFGQIWPRGNK